MSASEASHNVLKSAVIDSVENFRTMRADMQHSFCDAEQRHLVEWLEKVIPEE